MGQIKAEPATAKKPNRRPCPFEECQGRGRDDSAAIANQGKLRSLQRRRWRDGKTAAFQELGGTTTCPHIH